MTDNDLEKQTVWINKRDFDDLTILMDKIIEIHHIRMIYGVCYILTEDLDLEGLKRIFGGGNNDK